MFNPLLGNLKELKDVDLENKIVELGRKYAIASRTMSPGVVQQIAVILEQHRGELTRRQQEASKELAKRQDKKLDDLIKVN